MNWFGFSANSFSNHKMKDLKEDLFTERACNNLIQINSGKAENFFQCRMKHEQVLSGDSPGEFRYHPECPKIVKDLRVGCAHGDFLQTLRYAYGYFPNDQSEDPFAKKRINQVWDFEDKLGEIDSDMREVNKVLWCLESNMSPEKYLSSRERQLNKEQAKSTKLKLIERHHQYIRDILEYRDEVVIMLCKLLFKN